MWSLGGARIARIARIVIWRGPEGSLAGGRLARLAPFDRPEGLLAGARLARIAQVLAFCCVTEM